MQLNTTTTVQHGATDGPSLRRPRWTPATCAQCGNAFQSYRPSNKFCGNRCQRQHRKEHDTNRHRCKHCDRPYTPRSGTQGSGYCSTHCRGLHASANSYTNCPECGSRFMQLNRCKSGQKARRKYCSTACANTGRVRNRALLHCDTPPRIGLDLLEYAPDGRALDRWFRRLSDDQLRSVWVAAIAEQYGEGRRKEMLEALNYVRQRLQSTQAMKIEAA